MTLTADPRTRVTVREVRVGSAASTTPAPASPRPTLTTVRALDDVYRLLEDGRTIGYIQLAGPVFVALAGEVYNTSVEVAQCLDLDTAIRRLQSARG